MSHRVGVVVLVLGGMLTACGGAGSGADGGTGGGAGGGGGTVISVAGAITVAEIAEAFVYRDGGTLGCGPPFSVLLKGTVNTMTAASLEVDADGGVKFTSGALPAGTYFGGGATNTVSGAVVPGTATFECGGRVTLSNVAVTSFSTTFTLNGSLDVQATIVP
ncbi:MAG: hypothetical protein AB1938_32355 [Myxococcota bacterium]